MDPKQGDSSAPDPGLTPEEQKSKVGDLGRGSQEQTHGGGKEPLSPGQVPPPD